MSIAHLLPRSPSRSLAARAYRGADRNEGRAGPGLTVQAVNTDILKAVGGRTIPGLPMSPKVLASRYAFPEPTTEAVMGWGQKASGERAALIAARHGLACLRGEDGFIRSIRRDMLPLSLIIDDRGMHYDPARPSIIDAKLDARGALSGAQTMRIRAVVRAMIEGGVSKYNASRDPAALPDRPYVLVVDQTAYDCSVLASGGTKADFERMLARACEDHPDHLVVVRTHPDTTGGRSRGHFGADDVARHPNAVLDRSGSHICPLLDGAEMVYVFSSQVGFEALLRGRRVACFGTPFFAHRGLTEDFGPAPGYQRRLCSIDELAHAALIDATHYFHPETGESCAIETVIEHVALYRRTIGSDPARAVPFGFSRRKLETLRRFLPATDLVTDRRVIAKEPNLPVIAWGKAFDLAVDRTALPSNPSSIIRVEDGPVRSRGLGAAFAAPVSWIIDPFGIHYDPAEPSVIEKILLEHDFTPEDRERAADYRMRLIELGITKYNLHRGTEWTRPEGRRVILVPGQVECDMSIRYGSPAMKTNRALLEAVRRRNPEAYILYRPHPDVVGGFRPGDPQADGRGIADEIDCSADIHDVLCKVDAVEVMTSLTGMEALLRGIPVTCHGLPFFAGWGLTEDLVPCPRRNRTLTLDDLVFAAYIVSPRFVGPASGALITAEQALEVLALAPEPETSGRKTLLARLAGHWLARARRKVA